MNPGSHSGIDIGGVRYKDTHRCGHRPNVKSSYLCVVGLYTIFIFLFSYLYFIFTRNMIFFNKEGLIVAQVCCHGALHLYEQMPRSPPIVCGVGSLWIMVLGGRTALFSVQTQCHMLSCQ